MKSSTKRRFKKRKGLLGKAISLIEEGRGEDSSTRCTPCVPDFDRLSQLVSLISRWRG